MVLRPELTNFKANEHETECSMCFILQTNNFQAVVITNTTHTYYLFNYICGEMQWSGVDNDMAVVGYTLPGSYRNHPSSGYSSIANAVSCSIDLEKRRRRKRANQQNDGPVLEIPLDFGNGQGGPFGNQPQGEAVECTNAMQEDEILYCGFDPFPENQQEFFHKLSMNLPPCPETEDKAIADRGTFVRQTDIEEAPCYISARPTPLPDGISNSLGELSLTQQCCYSTK